MTFQLLVIRSSTLTRLERDEFKNSILCIDTKRVYQKGTSKFLKEEIFSYNNSGTKELYTQKKKSKNVNNNAQRGLARNRNSVQMRKREKGKDANNNRQTATLSLHQRLLDWTRKGKAR